MNPDPFRDPRSAQSAQITPRPNPWLDLAWVLVLAEFALLLITSHPYEGSLRSGAFACYVGLYVQFWGFLFLLSYLLPNGSHLLKWIMWLCEHAGHPRGRWTAILWFVFAWILGLAAIFIGAGVIRGTA